MTLLVYFPAILISSFKKRREKIFKIFLTNTDAFILHSYLYTNRIHVVAYHKLLNLDKYLSVYWTELDWVLN